MINVKDEVLGSEPRFRIRNNNGDIVQNNIIIERISPVVQEGTDVNKKLFDDLRKVYVKYDRNADLFYGTEEERKFEKGDLVIQDTTTKRIRRGMRSKLYQSSLLSIGTYHIVGNYFVYPTLNFTTRIIKLELYLRDWEKGEDKFISSVETKMPITNATENNRYKFVYLGNNKFGMIYNVSADSSTSAPKFFVDKYEFTDNSLVCYQRFTSTNIAGSTVGLDDIIRIKDNIYLTCWEQGTISGGRSTEVSFVVYDFDTDFVSNYVVTTNYDNFHQIQNAGIYNNANYFIYASERERTNNESDGRLYAMYVKLDTLELVFNKDLFYNVTGHSTSNSPRVSNVVDGKFAFLRQTVTGETYAIERCTLNYDTCAITGSNELTSAIVGTMLLLNGLLYKVVGTDMNMYEFDEAGNKYVLKGTVSFANEVDTSASGLSNFYPLDDKGNYVMKGSYFVLFMNIDENGIPSFKRLFPYEKVHSSTTLNTVNSEDGKYFIINKYFCYDEFYVTEGEKIFGIVDEIDEENNDIIIQRYGEKQVDLDFLGFVYYTPDGFKEKGMFMVGQNHKNTIVNLDFM